MTIGISDNIINQQVSKKDRDLYTKYQSKPAKDKNFDDFRKSIIGCKKEYQELVEYAEHNGIELKWDKNNKGFLDQETVQQLRESQIKYKDNAAAAKLYKRSLDSLAEAKALDTRSSQANLNVTKTSAMADKIKSASLYAKSGAYKIAAAAVNLFNSAIVREIALTAAISIGVMAVFSALTKLWEAIPTQNHLKERAEESATALQETRDEIDSTKSELETMGERIDELQSKGSLSFTEQEELERLQKENLELEKRLAILKKTEELQNKEATEDAWAAIEGMYGDGGNGSAKEERDFVGGNTISEQINSLVELKEAAESAQLAISEDDPNAQKKWDIEQEKIDAYDKRLSELVSDANDQLSNIDPSLLTDDQLAEYEKLQNAINSWLVSTGELSLEDVLKGTLGADQYDSAIQKMQELADSGKAVTESGLKEYFGKDMADEIANTVGGYDNLIERVNSMKNIGKVVAGYNGADKNNVLANISELINSEIAKIDADAIENNFSDKFIKYLDKCGISVEDLISYLQEMQTEANNIDFSDALTELTEIGDAIETLNDAYEQFAEDGYVDNDKLTKVAEQFASINDTDAYKDFITIISNSSSSIEQVENAMQDLINTYMTSNDVMSNLTEENKHLYESRLKSMGVSNASKIVEYNLQKAILGSARATKKAKEEAARNMAALMQEEWALKATGVAALDAATKLQLFSAYEQFAAGNNFADVVSNHAQALSNVANAAGPAASALAKYAEIVLTMSEITDMLNPESKNYAKDAGVRNLLKQQLNHYKEKVLPSLAEDAQSQFIDLATPDIDFTPGATTDINDSKDSGDTPAEKRKDAYDKAKEKLDYQLEQNIISYDTYYKKLEALGKKYLKGQKGNEKDWREHLAEMSDVREAAYDDEVADLDRMLEKGTISHGKYIEKIKAAREKWLKGRKANKEANEDALKDIADKQADFYDDEKDDLDNSLEKGKISWSSYYKKLLALQTTYLSDSKYNSEKLLEEQKAISDKALEYWEDQISKTEDKISRLTLTETWKPEESALDYWDSLFKKIRDAYTSNEISWDVYNELYYQILEKRKEAEEEYYNNQKEHLEDLIDLVSDMLKQEAEDMIDALEKQKDKYSEIVEEKKKALELTKNQLEYEDELKDDNEELSELQAQASLYALDSTSQGRAKLAEIMEKIAEKQDDISDKQRDHAYDATNDALDAANEAFQNSIQEKIDEINKNLSHQGLFLEGVYQFLTNTSPEEIFDKLSAYNYQYGDGKQSTVDNIWNNTKDNVINGTVQQTISRVSNGVESIDSTPSTHYKTKDEVIKLSYASKTRKQSHEQNLEFSDEIKRHFPNAYYDAVDKVWYTNESKLRTIAASPIIENMKSIANDKTLSQTKKKNQIAPLLSTLKTYWGYKNAHMDYAKMHLYKTKGKAIKVFHSGLAGGFVGEGYSPSQRESYTLLTNDELVLNKSDQFRLANQIQVWDSVKKALGGLVDYVGSVGTMTPSSINITIEAPVNIAGNADANTAKELEKFGKKIANETLSKLQSAMGQRGYSTRVSQGAMKKL